MKISNKIIGQFKNALSSEGMRYTNQRLEVLKDILTHHKHRDCEEIYSSLVEKKIKISRATIYRTLEVLEGHNFIRKLVLGEGSVKYERKINHPRHGHMICVESDDIIEFVDPRIEKIVDGIAAKKGYKIIKHVHQLFVKPLNNEN
ncbi:MAG: hypothetical protein CMG00_02725 [Candidatus Marinimicrobia bacterium]|nr:hypothetical protein [Candidatus Neomarinimicrobiota bacterium]|tara:strand:- start:483 stop:920 length:438 start_codon:yes stop_codon:yes gene_type:complete